MPIYNADLSNFTPEEIRRIYGEDSWGSRINSVSPGFNLPMASIQKPVEIKESDYEQQGNPFDWTSAIGNGLAIAGTAAGILNSANQAAQVNRPIGVDAQIGNLRSIGSGSQMSDSDIINGYRNVNSNAGVGGYDYRGMTTKDKVGNVATSALSGAATGLQVAGPWGALAGLAIGGVGAGLGVLTGDKKANINQASAQSDFNIASSDATNNLGASVDRNRRNTYGSLRANRVAEGGRITTAAKKRNMSVMDFAKKVRAQREANRFAEGGNKNTISGMNDYSTHGVLFTPPGYTHIGAGGTHEQNPYGGVPVGVDPNGKPNLVEEGENIYNDYVFSDRLKPSKRELKSYNLPEKLYGKTFAELSDALMEEANTRPNDPISNNGVGAMLDRLIACQEEHKAKKDQKELMKNQKDMQNLQMFIDSLDERQLNQLASRLGGEQQTVDPMQQQYQQMPQEQIPMEEQMIPQEQNMFAFGDRMNRKNKSGNNGVGNLPTYMRYAPVFDAAGKSLLTALQSPDRTLERGYRQIADNIPSSHISYNPAEVGYRYNPVDEQMTANQINSQAAASRRAAMNSGAGPSVGTMLVALNDANNQAIGTNAYTASQANNNARNQIAQLVNQAGLQRASGQMQADAYNAQMGLSRSQQANYQRDLALQAYDAEQTARAAAMTANTNKIAEGLHGTGRENFYMNQINNDTTKAYYIMPDGSRYMWKGNQLVKVADEQVACGGALMKKYR